MIKVCILTAGTGSRLRPLTENINKAILPLGGKAVISHIIDKFPKSTEFIIATGYLSATVKDYLELAHPDHNFAFVDVEHYSGEGCGPGYSLLQCEPFLQEPFYFFSCDTVVEGDIPEEIGDWIGVAPTDDPASYCTVSAKNSNVTELHDKVYEGSNSAFIGLAKIQNYQPFFAALKKSMKTLVGEPQITSGLKELIKSNALKTIEFSWHDTGNKVNYTIAQKYFSGEGFDFSKTNEYLYFEENRVIKYFADQKIAEMRFSRSKTIEKFAPKILKCQNGFYAYKFINGKVLYDCDLKSIIEPLLRWLHNDFWLEKELDSNDQLAFTAACLKFYKEKTYARLDDFFKRENRPDFLCGDIAGEQVPTLESLLVRINWHELANGTPVRFHGDLQFDNILQTDDSEFKLIDWRQDFAGLIDYGDIHYDLAKLVGGILIPYKNIKLGEFSFEFSNGNSNFDVPKIEDYHFVKDTFYQYLDVMGIDKTKVCLITSLIFLNMAPLHEYPFSNLLYSAGRKSLSSALDGQTL